jgi:hypothetical protein
MMKQLLIDVDCLLYRYGYMRRDDGDTSGFEGSGFAPELDQFTCAKEAISQKLEYLLQDYPGYSLVPVLLPRGTKNHRYDIYPKYKQHRKEPDPIIGDLKDWFLGEYQDILASVPEGFTGESDDLLADLHIEGTILVGIDKDFNTLPGMKLHPFTGDLTKIRPREAHVFLYYQVLVGDSADGIPGCPGIGDKKASTILMKALEAGMPLEHVTLFTYRLYGLTKEDWLMNYRLLKLGYFDRTDPISDIGYLEEVLYWCKRQLEEN